MDNRLAEGSRRQQQSEYDKEDENSAVMMGRACDHCRKMKMRCIGKENPPCQRCQAGNHTCTFEHMKKAKGAAKVDDRLQSLESAMENVQSTLHSLLELQRSMASRSNPSPSERPNTPHTVYPLSTAISSARPPLPTPSWTSNPSSSTPPNYQALAPPHPSSSSPYHPPLPPFINPQPNLPRPMHYPQAPTAASFNSRPSSISALISPPDHGTSSSPSEDSESDDAPAKPSGLRGMLQLSEAARLQADGEISSPLVTASRDRKRPRKKAKRAGSAQAGGTEEDARSRKADGPAPRTWKGIPHANPDPIDLGMCDVDTAKRLFDQFFEGSHPFMPVYDPAYDTFESLRMRSPFSITAMLMIGKKVEDSENGVISDLQIKLRAHSEKMGMTTLFSPVMRIEAVQAMMLVSLWGDTHWRPGNHTISIAMDMGLYRCLPHLASSGMGAGKTAAELEEEDRMMVIGARAWLGVFKLRVELCINHHRPAYFINDNTIHYARAFLDHPLAVPSDVRLVSACEHLHVRFCAQEAIAENLDEGVREGLRKTQEWRDYWDSYYANKGVASDHFLRQALISQSSHAFLQISIMALGGVRTSRDFGDESDDRRRYASVALGAASTVMDLCLRGGGYRKNFKYGNHYSHVAMAFVVRNMIRLVSLMPEAVDLRKTTKDIEQVVNILEKVPGFQLAQHLRNIISRARRARFLPNAQSMSPSRVALPLPDPDQPPPTTYANPGLPLPATASTDQQYGTAYPLSSLPPHLQPQLGTSAPTFGSAGLGMASNAMGLDMDFTYAERLLLDTQGSSNSGGGGGVEPVVQPGYLNTINYQLEPFLWDPAEGSLVNALWQVPYGTDQASYETNMAQMEIPAATYGSVQQRW